jgi:hypothetical protein
MTYRLLGPTPYSSPSKLGPELDPAATCESWRRRTKPLHPQPVS